MSRQDLLGVWEQTRRSAELWRAVMGQASTELLRAVARGLASPQSPDEVARSLIEEGAFEQAELLLIDDHFAASIDLERRNELEAQLEGARSRAFDTMNRELEQLRLRADPLNLELNTDAVVEVAVQSQSQARGLLQDLEAQVEEAEQEHQEALRAKARAVKKGELDAVDLERWRMSVEQSIELGELHAAEASLARGPTADRPPALKVPTLPIWPHRQERWQDVVAWFLGNQARPPAFDRYLPADEHGQELIRALGSWARLDDTTQRSLTLMALANVLGCNTSEIREHQSGCTMRFDDLSAPGLHAFGRSRWPQGVPILLPCRDPDLRLEESRLGLEEAEWVIRLAVEETPVRDREIPLDIHDVLAALSTPMPRQTLLACVGRRFPLAYAFGGSTADLSVRWERSDIPEPLRQRGAIVVLLGAPGLGKSTLMQVLCEEEPEHRLLSPKDVDDLANLPSTRLLVLDDMETLDEDQLAKVSGELDWASEMGDVPDRVILSGRPELALKLPADHSYPMETLAHRSLDALRAQARTMLGWLGVQAETPGLHTRMAFMASGNPSILYLLCGTLCRRIAERREGHRRFIQDDLDAAWHDDQLREQMAALLIDPVRAVDGALAVLSAVTEFGLDHPLTMDELEQALALLRNMTHDRPWLEARVKLLQRYGLLERKDDVVQLASGGIGAVVRDLSVEGFEE